MIITRYLKDSLALVGLFGVIYLWALLMLAVSV